MREILFRAKRTSLNGWIEGFVSSPFRDTMCLFYELSTGKEWYVDDNTVGQYTGLTDKNGKKIFEGDIVAGALWWQEQPKNGLVTFRDGSFGLLWYRGKIEQFAPFTSMCNIVYEVIGTIHDNPELLKGGAE